MSQPYPELANISDEHPAGVDARYETEFEELQAEIDKLSLPSAQGEVSWARIKSLASEILSKQSKDLLVASYLVVAKAKTERQDGLATGLNIFSSLLENFWDDLFPAKKRMRGRIAAVIWLLEKSDSAFDERQLTPISQDVKDCLISELNRLDTLFEKYFDDYSKPDTIRASNKLHWIIDKSLVDGRSEGENQNKPEQQLIPDIPTPSSKDEGGEEEKKEEAEKKRVSPAPPPAEEHAAEPPAAQASEPPATVSPSSGSLSSSADIDKNLRAAFLAVRHVGDYYFNNNLFDPRGYRYRRIAGWSMIEKLPPAADNQTQIPSPGEFNQVKQKLDELRESGNWQELLQLSETRLQSALLWLDLNRYSAESLSALGSKYQDAHDALCQETQTLLARLPGLETLKYTDGSPLADNETKQWLEAMVGVTQPYGQPAELSSDHSDEHVTAILEKAQQLAATKKVAEAVSHISDEMKRCSSRREVLIWRINLAQLLIQYRHLKFAIPHLDEIIKEIDEYKLDTWDPLFAAQALKVVWSGLRQDKNMRDRADLILSRIAKLDPAGVFQLEKK